MLLDFLAPLAGLEIIERTSSTLRVQQVVQLSLAPAFLLAGIGAVMNVMTNRLIWVANKIERILAADERDFALSFAALHFTNPERNRYRYRLAEYDDDWREAWQTDFLSGVRVARVPMRITRPKPH